MAEKLRFVMIGGFLGAGKTTAMARLARHHIAAGRRVGIVTNDQAQDLVDTNSLRAQGFSVAEVPGACFCCKFDELVGRVGDLSRGDRPEIILAEPVGSCTDLVATVVQPLKDLYGDRFEIAPYSVIFKPSHGLRILRGDGGAGFSPKAAYIFRKQLEEADAILINRIDELSADESAELTSLLNRDYPGTPVLKVSARTGAGFDGLIEVLDWKGEFGRKILSIDYDIYAAGEAELGWLNSSVHVTSSETFALDDFILAVIEDIARSLKTGGEAAEVAHLKVIGLCDAAFGVANLVSSRTAPELSLPSHAKIREADVIVNARVAMDPAELERHVRRSLEAAAKAGGARLDFRSTQSFRPGRPTPTHRYAAPA